jgi:hypothetical protein
MTTSARGFVIQLSALGFLARFVQILAILSLLSLNDYFTTPSQIPALLPIGLLIVILLILVVIADSISFQIISRLTERLTTIYSVYGSRSIPPITKGRFRENIYYLRTIFLPLLTAVATAPLLAIVLALNTPYLFLVTIIQSISNAIIILYYNRTEKNLFSLQKNSLESERVNGRSSSNYVYRHTNSHRSKQIRDVTPEEPSEFSNFSFSRKKDAIRASNLVFRAIILILSAILSIYKLSSLSGVIGFFILNNTLRASVIVLAEYCWPACRYLTFQQSFALIAAALQDEDSLLRRIEIRQQQQRNKWTAFDQRMREPIQAKPYLRLKDLRLSQSQPTYQSLLKSVTGRIELLAINILVVNGSNLAALISAFCDDQEDSLLEAEAQGTAVCGQVKIESFFWRSLPISNPNLIRIISVRLIDHFDQAHHPRLNRLIMAYDLESLYLQSDNPAHALSDLSRKQIFRMRSLIAILHSIIDSHVLWLLPFVLDVFEDGQIQFLLDFYSHEQSTSQRSLFLMSRTVVFEKKTHGYYQVSSMSLDTLS